MHVTRKSCYTAQKELALVEDTRHAPILIEEPLALEAPIQAMTSGQVSTCP